MLWIDQLRNCKTGELLKGFFVRNKAHKILALGAEGCFVQMSAKRYQNDLDLVAKVARLTGLEPRRVW
jgi:hypothetical protein